MATALHVLPADARNLLEEELDEAEKVMWVGRPRPGRSALRTLPILLFAVPWTGFALFWMYMAWSNGAPLPFVLFGTPFVLVGLGMLSSPLWSFRKARRTAYAVTDRRALIICAGISSSIRAFGAEDLEDLTKNKRADGSGDILFESESRRPIRRKHRSLGFFGIDRVDHVHKLLRALVARSRGD